MPKTIVFYRVEDLYRTLRMIGPEASERLRDASQSIADKVAADAAANARSVGGVARLVAPTIRGKRDRIPAVVMGSREKLPLSGDGWSRKSRKGRRQTIGDVIWGAEFGGATGTMSDRRTTQFMPWRGNSHGAGYFLFPAVRQNREFIEQAYGDAILAAVDEAAS